MGSRKLGGTWTGAASGSVAVFIDGNGRECGRVKTWTITDDTLVVPDGKSIPKAAVTVELHTVNGPTYFGVSLAE